MLRTLCWALAGLAACWTVPPSYGQFGGGCFGTPGTLSESVNQAQAVYLVRWISISPPDGEEESGEESTTFEILDVLKPGTPALAPRGGFVLDFHVEGKRGDLFLLFGTREEETFSVDDAVFDEVDPNTKQKLAELEIDWNLSEPISEAAYHYLRHAPPSPDVCGEANSNHRLKYFLKFLNDPDETIASDAFAEFDQVPWNELARLVDQFPKVRLRAWLRAEETPPQHRELYGLMLGLCGAPADAKLLEGLLLERDEEFWFDRGRLYVGYLLLAGERGMDRLDETVLKDGASLECDTALAAIASLEEFFPQTIEPERLRRSLRRLLDRPDLAATAIDLLVHMADWDAQPQVTRLFDSCGYEDSSIKLAIISYLRASAEAHGEHAAEAKQLLTALRKTDPEIVKEFVEHFGELDGDPSQGGAGGCV